jgi:hypothetical protein
MIGAKLTFAFVGALLALAGVGPAVSLMRAAVASDELVRSNYNLLAEAVWRQAHRPDVLINVPVRGDPPDMNACDMELLETARSGHELSEEDAWRHIRANDLMFDAAVETRALDRWQLGGLSWRKLALLKGCMEASILAPLCKRHVRKAADKVRDASAGRYAAEWAELRRLDDERRCADAAYFRARQ